MLKFEAQLCVMISGSLNWRMLGSFEVVGFLHMPMELLQRFRMQEEGEHPF
jgi:hypothetical protein